MNKIQLSDQLKRFIGTDIQAFALKNPLQLSSELLIWSANQLHFYNKLRNKVPAWFEIKSLESPPALSIEQSSSQITAEFKADLCEGELCVDLTGGMGIDSYFFSKAVTSVIYVEQNNEVVTVTKHNFNELAAENISVIHQKAEEFLMEFDGKANLIYLDPARRDERGGKVFFIEDCSPDVGSLLPLLFSKTEKVLIKYAPMLDIKKAIQTLRYVSKVIVLAVSNEVKEVLYLLEKNFTTDPEIETVNIMKSSIETFSFTFAEEENAQLILSQPLNFLYEPNAAIMKAGAFKSISINYDVTKLAINSHLYTSNSVVTNFPGRSFTIEKSVKFDKKVLKKLLKNQYINVNCRNFPIKPEQLKQLFGYVDGGDDYLFFTQNHLQEKIVIFTRKLS